MQMFQYVQVVECVQRLCIDCAYTLPQDVLSALVDAKARESNARAKELLAKLIENAQIAKDQRIPLCQDTGLVVVFVEQGANTVIAPLPEKPTATIIDAIQDGVAAGYEKGFLRNSVVAEPLNERKNTQTNTPAVIHHEVVPGANIKITLMAKGGGCENKSQFKMFNPTESKEVVADWIVEVVKNAGANACPPFVIGIGMGGNFEVSCLLSKKALLRNIGEVHTDVFYAQMEKDVLAMINATGLGPQGLGGNTTALAVCIETAPCHIASLPVAVNIECHSHRHKSIVL
jgi:fumarate hydratase subunit alpha